MIKINNLSFSYSGKKPYQLNDINLTLPENEFISIVGENGSSKTTLLKLLLGYLKPIKGNIEINLNSVGYVPQKVDNFNSQFSITVYEVLKVHILILDEPSTGIDEKTQKDIYELIYKLNKEKEMTIICVEHNIRKSLKYSSYILELKDSKATLFKNNEYLKKLDEINNEFI